MAVTTERVIRQLVDNGLVTEQHILELRNSPAGSATFASTEALIRSLVRAGLLTLFQGKMAAAGKTDQLVIGSYLLLEHLGQGGMGQVFKARHRTMKREVALKLISSAAVRDPISQQRFQREVEAAARLSHPNIVTAHDAGESRGSPFLVMEYIKGSDLASLIRRGGPLSAVKAVGCILQVAQGLAYAHGMGVVHRDIKPANLLMDPVGTVKILDMGLARFHDAAHDAAAEGALTGTGVLMGTVDYMAPEQAMDSKSADARSDVYSLGCTLYFLMTGRAIYESDTIVKRIMQHQSAAIPVLSPADPQLQHIFERLVAKQPASRLASAREVCDELQRWLDHAAQAALLPTREMPVVAGYSVPESLFLAGEPVRDEDFAPPSSDAPDPARTPSRQDPNTAVTRGMSGDTTPSLADGAAAPRQQSQAPAARKSQSSTQNRTRPRISPEGPVNVVTDRNAAPGEQRAGVADSPVRRRQLQQLARRRSAVRRAKTTSGITWLDWRILAGAAVVLSLVFGGLSLRRGQPLATVVIDFDQPEIAGAVITVDDQEVASLSASPGSEQVKIPADGREHLLAVSQPGFETYTRKLTAESDASQQIDVRLRPLPDSRTAGESTAAQPALSPRAGADPPLAEGAPEAGSASVSSGLPPVDFAAERRAATWLASTMQQGYAVLRLANDTTATISPTSRSLPADDFVVEEIRVSAEAGIDDAGLAAVSGCRRLKYVELSQNPVTTTGLQHFVDCSTIESLDVSYTAIDDQSLSLLAGWPGLQMFSARGCSQISDAAIANLRLQPSLRDFAVGETGVSDAGLQLLAQRAPGLETLNLIQHQGDALRTLSAASNFARLRTLVCSTQQVTPDGVAAIARHPAVVQLEIHGTPNDLTFERLQPLQDRLQQLNVFSNLLVSEAPTGRGFTALAQQRMLQNLTLHGQQGSPSDADLIRLAALPALRRLQLSFPVTAMATTASDAQRLYTPEGIAAFRALRPDVSVRADGTDYAPTAEFGTVSIPPVPAWTDPVGAPASAVGVSDPVLSGTLAEFDLRNSEGISQRPAFRERLRPGEPLGEFATVSRPGRLPGLVSWSLEPLVHRGGLYSVAVSRRGWIATGGSDCVIRIWTPDWQLIKVLPGHANTVRSLVFSPDGQQLASVSNSPRANVALWDVVSGQLIWSRTIDQHWEGQLTWSPDAQTLAVCEPGRLLLLNPGTGEIRSERAVSGFLLKAAWSPDSARLAFLHLHASGIKVVDVSTMEEIRTVGTQGGDGDVDWSTDGRWLGILDAAGLEIYDTRTFERQLMIAGPGMYMKFSPDSSQVAVATHGQGTMFSTSDWQPIWRTTCHTPIPAWNHDGSEVVFGTERFRSADGVRLSSLDARFLTTVVCPTGDGRQVATTCDAGLRIWDGENGSLLHDFPHNRPGTQQLLWNPQGTMLLRLGPTSPADSAELIDASTGSTQHVLSGHRGRTTRVCWAPTGKQAATVGEDGQCILWDPVTGQPVRKLAHAEPQDWVQWSTDGKYLACGSQTAITVWDAVTGDQKRAFRTLSQRLFSSNTTTTGQAPFSFMKDSNQLTVLGKENGFDLLDVSTGLIVPLGSVLATAGGAGSRFTAAWSPDFTVLGSHTSYREFELFRKGTAEGQAIRFFVQPHWLADSRRLLGGDNQNGFVAAFDVKTMRRLGVLLPELPGRRYMAIGAEGYYSGSPECEEHVVAVALHPNGSLKTFSLEEFSRLYGWKNDATQVRLLNIR